MKHRHRGFQILVDDSIYSKHLVIIQISIVVNQWSVYSSCLMPVCYIINDIMNLTPAWDRLHHRLRHLFFVSVFYSLQSMTANSFE